MIAYPQLFLQELIKDVLHTLVHFNCNGCVKRRLLWDVPAVAAPYHSEAVSSGMKLLQQELHVDPVAAVKGEHQNVPSVARRGEGNQTNAEENKYSTDTRQGHGS